jgi:hypothetical protein
MTNIRALSSFYSAIEDDNRIAATHISVYMALFYFYHLNLLHNPIFITRESVMRAAKINGVATYHKCIKDLAKFGYIKYEPSFHPGKHSQVILLFGSVSCM